MYMHMDIFFEIKKRYVKGLDSFGVIEKLWTILKWTINLVFDTVFYLNELSLQAKVSW